MRMRSAAPALIALVAVSPCLAQRPSTAPRTAGVRPGQARSQVAMSLACYSPRDSAARDPIQRLDSISLSVHPDYPFTACRHEEEGREATLYFARDTLVRVVAPDRAGPALPAIPPGPFDFRGYLAAVWERYRSRASALIGTAPDSVRTAVNPPAGALQLAVVTAYWAPNATRRWNARLELIAVAQSGRVHVLPRTIVEDPCVTSVPWLTCPPLR
jgi:hypothetical protein